jgi:hypothetical protein
VCSRVFVDMAGGMVVVVGSIVWHTEIDNGLIAMGVSRVFW